MDLQKLESIVRRKICPRCNRGIMTDTGGNIYVCRYEECGEEYDLSSLPVAMLDALLARAKTMEAEPDI